MTRTLHRPLAALLACLALGWTLTAAEPTAPVKKPEAKAPALPDLSQFKTVDTAIKTRVSLAASEDQPAPQPGYLGIQVAADAGGRLVVAEVEADSPAARAGLQAGDVLVKFAGKPVPSAETLRELLHAQAPGAAVKLALTRKEKSLEVPVTLAATSRPMQIRPRAVLGVYAALPKEGEGLVLEEIVSGSAAAKAGLERGDVVLKIDGTPLKSPENLSEILSRKNPGDPVTLTLKWNRKVVDLKVTLGAETRRGGRGRRGWDSRVLTYWTRDRYRLAVVCVEYPDVKHNAKITAKDWEDALFSTKTYVKKSVTGQPVFGSLSDYYQEQSYGKLRVTGKVFPYVQVSKKRTEYGQGNDFRTRTALLTEALDKLLARDGKDALKDFDGLFFMYAGDRVRTNRGGLYWPHRSSVSHQGKRWPYFICPEGGPRMADISVACHEFGHLLGLPDLYARPEEPGSRGVGAWCAMSEQAGNGRPQHFCAWSKEKLGWLTPAVINPTVKQKLILAPVEDSPKECFKVLVRPDGSEYFLLENRRKKGFDQSVPAEGLVIWRVVQNRPGLVESHGIAGPPGPRLYPFAVPFPSPANNALTPYTTPSSRGQLGGGLPVHITNIRRLPDGRITFYIGYEYL